jgi:hypothetical protein
MSEVTTDHRSPLAADGHHPRTEPVASLSICCHDAPLPSPPCLMPFWYLPHASGIGRFALHRPRCLQRVAHVSRIMATGQPGQLWSWLGQLLRSVAAFRPGQHHGTPGHKTRAYGRNRPSTDGILFLFLIPFSFKYILENSINV